MKKAFSFSIPTLSLCGAAIVFGLPSPASATTILASYSGAYSVVSRQPVTEGVASFRLTLAPLFADCTTAGECTELMRGENVGAISSGTSFELTNRPVVLAALANRASDLFSLSMNFGPVFSSALSGGGTGFFDTVLAGYTAAPVESIVFTIDRLIFQTVQTPFGLSTEAALTYTLALLGPGAPTIPGAANPPLGVTPPTPPRFEPISTDFSGFPTQNQLADAPSANVPEPASWLPLACGLAIVALSKSARRSS